MTPSTLAETLTSWSPGVTLAMLSVDPVTCSTSMEGVYGGLACGASRALLGFRWGRAELLLARRAILVRLASCGCPGKGLQVLGPPAFEIR